MSFPACAPAAYMLPAVRQYTRRGAQ
jgi:hypothetical protein